MRLPLALSVLVVAILAGCGGGGGPARPAHTTSVPPSMRETAEHPEFNRLLSAFANVAGHRVDGAVGYSCHDPGRMHAGTVIRCSVTIQSSSREPRYAVRLRGDGCWRAISLSGGADLAGCTPRWTGG